MTSDRDRIALVVHEVRSPTAALAAIADALAAAELDDGSRRTLIGLSLAACQSIERILTDADLGSLRLEHIDIRAIARDAVASAQLGGARVRTNFDTVLPVILGDRVRLRQALDNLIENAVAAGSSEGDVTVSIQACEPMIVVSVTDRGGGIPAEDHARIFEPGVRLDRRSRGDEGSGLGLAIVRAVAVAHGGRAGVDSAPGQGATFTIVLPIDQPATVATKS